MSFSHPIIRRAGAAGMAAAVTGTAVLLFAGGSASAKTTTLHFFSKSVANGAFQADGQPITNQNAQPAVGDYFTSSDLDYVGNHKSHAKTSTGSDHLVCTVTTSTATSLTGLCDAVIAVGGSLLVADHVTLDLTNNITSVPINGGTGQFKGAHGTVGSKQVGTSNNSDFTITYTN